MADGAGLKVLGLMMTMIMMTMMMERAARQVGEVGKYGV